MAVHGQAVARRAGPGPQTLVGTLIALGCAAALLTPRFLPFYDYPEWLLQGQIVHDLWTGATRDGVAVARLYALLPVPVPNLAAPVGIALLAFVLPIEMAGRVFLLLGVLGFGGAYAALVRTLQGRPTALELTGLIWAFGYFLQRGYVSYLFALPLAFVGIALAHRFVDGGAGRARLTLLCAVQLLTFLAHLVAWGVLVLVVVCSATVLFCSDRRDAALRLVATTLPGIALLVWYTAAAKEVGHLALYTSLRDKALSLAEAGQFFLRLDPYPGVVPIFAAQLVTTIALLAVVGSGVCWATLRSAPRLAVRNPAARAALLLAALAVADPVSNVNSLTKPDQRLLFPAVLLLLAALPWRPLRTRARAAAAGTVVVTLLLHGLGWVSLDGPLLRALAAVDGAVPADAAVTTIAVPTDGGCAPGAGPTIGIPALKWFDVHRMLAHHEVRADLQETSAVVLRFDPRTEPGLTTLSIAAQSAPAALAADPAAVVEVFACPADAGVVVAALAPRYTAVATGDGYAVLRRKF